MTEIDSYPAGMPCWTDVACHDTAAGVAFYRELFGWEVDQDGNYATFLIGDRSVAGLGPCQRGTRPSWNAYFSVTDVDASVATARAAGGRLVAGPGDVPSAGRAAAVADPQGAVFTLWQPREHHGAGLAGLPGTWYWTEVVTTDVPAAAAFYAAVFGWSVRSGTDPSAGAAALLDGRGVAGFSPVARDTGIEPHWSVTFEVANCDDAVAAVSRLGGTVVIGARDVPAVGRYAIVAGPDGETFSVLQPVSSPPA